MHFQWTTDQDLIDAITALGIGDLLDVKIYENRNNGQSKGYAIVTVSSEASSRALLDRLASQELHGQKPNVMVASRQNISVFENQHRQSLPQRRPRDFDSGNRGDDQGGRPPFKYGRGRGDFRDRGERDNDRNVDDSKPGRENGHHRDHRNDNSSGNGPMMGGPFGPMAAAMGMRPGMVPNAQMGFGAPNPMMAAMMASGQMPPAAAAQMMAAMGGGMGGNVSGGANSSSGSGNPLQLQAALMAARMNAPTSQSNQGGANPAHGNIRPTGPNSLSRDNSQSNGSGNQTANLQAQLAAAGLLPGSANKSTAAPQASSDIVTSSASGMPGNLASLFNSSNMGSAANPFMAAISAAAAAAAQQAQQNQSGLSGAEAEEILTRNKTICSSAISRAVQDAAAGDFPGAIETLVTALSLIKQSKMASDERCKMLVDSLQNTLRGIEEKYYATKYALNVISNIFQTFTVHF